MSMNLKVDALLSCYVWYTKNMKLNRLLEIVHILMHKESVTAPFLADKFSVSKRTIYRDIDTLSLSGIPVYTEQGKGGGISLLPEYVLNKTLLSEQEQNEILTALHGLSKIKADETDRVLQKISSFFNKSATDWLEVDFSDWGNESNTIIFDNFKKAILERKVVTFDYYNRYGQKTFRRIEPMKLWYKSHSWYIKGFCLIKNEQRLYKVTRVENLVITNDVFELRDINDSENKLNTEQLTTFRFHIAPEMAYRVFDFFHEGNVERMEDGSFIVKATWGEDNWVYGFVLSFGEYIEVLEPEHLREIIKEKSEKISKIYS